MLIVSKGAGKTFTMLGTQNNPGIYSRALNDLFLLVAKYEEENVNSVSMSYLEVSNYGTIPQLSSSCKINNRSDFV